jgi:tetratricopeptide (TPR) repeat protein
VENGFHLIQIFLRSPDQEPGFLAGLAHYLSSFKTIVTFNGKAFDIPMLNTRHVLNGFSTPFSQLQHIDLLPLARRLWRNRLTSRALKDLEVEILDLSRTDEEVPGWMIPELYYEYLRSKDARPLANVLYHNAQDILSLGLLLNVMADLLENPIKSSPKQGLDLIAVARLYEEMNRWQTAVQLYEHSLAEGNLPLPFYLDTIKRYANLYRKQERYEDALQLWIKAAEYRQVDACIEIAKYYEHRQKDSRSALQWVETAFTYLNDMPSIPTRRYLQEGLTHRANRLQQKLEHNSGK